MHLATQRGNECCWHVSVTRRRILRQEIMQSVVGCCRIPFAKRSHFERLSSTATDQTSENQSYVSVQGFLNPVLSSLRSGFVVHAKVPFLLLEVHVPFAIAVCYLHPSWSLIGCVFGVFHVALCLSWRQNSAVRTFSSLFYFAVCRWQ